MSDPKGSAPPDPTSLNNIALKFFGSLLLLGGAAVLATAVAIRQFPTVMRGGGLIYVLPGSGGRHGLEPTATLVLLAAGGMLALAGVTGLVIGRLKGDGVLAGLSFTRTRPSSARLRRPARILIVGVAALAAALIYRAMASHP